MTVLLATLVTAILLPLAVTIVLETGVAALFGLRRRGLTTVISVNFITNPSLNLLLLVLAWLGIGYRQVDAPSPAVGTVLVPTFWGWFTLILLEVLIVVVEWRMLVWALGKKDFSSRKLFVLSLVMNAVSAVLGSFLLRYIPV